MFDSVLMSSVLLQACMHAKKKKKVDELSVKVVLLAMHIYLCLSIHKL